MMPFLERIEAVAAQRGDEFHRRLARWPKELCVTDAALAGPGPPAGDRYLQAWVPICLPGSWPKTTRCGCPVVAEADAVAAASGMRSLRDLRALAEPNGARSTGDLVTAIELTTDLLQGPWSPWWRDAIRCLSFAALLAEDERRASLRASTPASEPAYLTPASHSGPSTAAAPARLAARSAQRRRVPTSATLRGRRRARRCGSEAARRSTPGPADVAVDHARFWARPEPHPSSRRRRDRRLPRLATRTAGTTRSPSPSTRACGSSPSTPSKASPSPPPGRELGRVPTAPRRCATSP